MERLLDHSSHLSYGLSTECHGSYSVVSVWQLHFVLIALSAHILAYRAYTQVTTVKFQDGPPLTVHNFILTRMRGLPATRKTAGSRRILTFLDTTQQTGHTVINYLYTSSIDLGGTDHEHAISKGFFVSAFQVLSFAEKYQLDALAGLVRAKVEEAFTQGGSETVIRAAEAAWGYGVTSPISHGLPMLGERLDRLYDDHVAPRTTRSNDGGMIVSMTALDYPDSKNFPVFMAAVTKKKEANGADEIVRLHQSLAACKRILAVIAERQEKGQDEPRIIKVDLDSSVFRQKRRHGTTRSPPLHVQPATKPDRHSRKREPVQAGLDDKS